MALANTQVPQAINSTTANPVGPPAGSGPVYFNSPYRVISKAMQNAGYLAKNQWATGEDYATHIQGFNDYINFLQTQGLKLWLQQDLAITPQAGFNQYNWGPAGNVTIARPPRFLEGYYADSNQVRRPLIPLSRNEWDMLSTTSSPGQISNYFVDKQQASTNLYLWLTPDATAATGTVHMLVQVQVNNMISLTDTVNFPPEWYLVLQWGYANEIATGQPKELTDKCKMQSDYYMQKAEDWDVEDASTFFQPDQRTQYVGYRFK